MTTIQSGATAPVTLGTDFATALPELALPWQAEAAPEPRLLALDQALAAELGLDPEWLRSDDGVRFLVGNAVPEGATPVAQCYAGHQFGGYAPRLGDGRAMLLGELTDTHGVRRDLHLKGSGRTPFARGGDGRAAVGPMLREYVVSTAMHALGIPTTRSLAVVATGRQVQREVPLPGAVLVRVASSHLRVGSFQYAAAQAGQSGDLGLLRRLTDHAIARHHPDAAGAGIERPALQLYEAVVHAQASLMAQWMLVGFVHGVMNTDNMTISGETIDYGPCAFMESFDRSTVFSSIDEGGRYAYGNQPPIAEWNLARLGECLVPLVDDDQGRAVELVTEALGGFRDTFTARWTELLSAKLGLAPDTAGAAPVTGDLLVLMQENRPDFTSFFRALSTGPSGGSGARDLVLDVAGFDAWHARWQALSPDLGLMRRTNPVVVPRNHLVEASLDAATAGDLEPFGRLVDAVGRPFEERDGFEAYAEPSPDRSAGYVTFCGT